MRIYCATGNAGKLREFALAAERLAQGRFSVEPVPGLSSIAPPEETGATFRDNAILKALYYARFVDDPVFTDDSGLAVDALNGAPGVYSARFAGPNATDEDNNRRVLAQMDAVSDRTAQFVCVIALAWRENVLATFEGKVEGQLLTSPRGSRGFGYDPLFFYPPFGCTLAEATAAQKLSVSHRGQALEAMFRWLAAGGLESAGTARR